MTFQAPDWLIRIILVNWRHTRACILRQNLKHTFFSEKLKAKSVKISVVDFCIFTNQPDPWVQFPNSIQYSIIYASINIMEIFSHIIQEAMRFYVPKMSSAAKCVFEHQNKHKLRNLFNLVTACHFPLNESRDNMDCKATHGWRGNYSRSNTNGL